jgi:hypothetical protein
MTFNAKVNFYFYFRCREQHIRYEEFAFSQDGVPLDKTTEFHEEPPRENEETSPKNPADISLDDLNLDRSSISICASSDSLFQHILTLYHRWIISSSL